MRFWLPLLLAFLVCVRSSAQNLPDLGDVSQAVFSPALERQVGENIMQQVRADPAYFDDPVVSDYLNVLGNRLASFSPDPRQQFEFFALRDTSVNAFALPGGFIGVHTGLLLTAQTESELASVLAHEIAHVTQRHIARMVAGQERTGLATLAAMALGLLAARANSNVAQAVIAGSQAAAIQSQINYTRDHEREADRVGVQIMQQSGLDARAMPTFMERLQRAMRLYESGAPAYLQTHPVTTERIADLQNRTEDLGYRQVPDNADFQLVRARVRVAGTEPRQALAFFEQSLKERRFLNEAATHYGLTLSLVKLKDIPRAKRELAALEQLLPGHPTVSALRGEVLAASGDVGSALAHYAAALKAHPNNRALVYDYADMLLRNGRAEMALKVVESRQTAHPDEVRLYTLQSRSHAALGNRLLQHRAQAEVYLRQGHLGAAVEQLQLAVRAGDGDFYQLSATEARLRELRARLKEAEKLRKQQQ